MFTDPIGGNGFALSRVESYYRRGKEITVTMVGGEVHTIEESSWHFSLNNTVQAAFPAQPGTFLVDKLVDGGTVVDVQTVPVLGFVIDAVGIVKAATTQGIAEDNSVILHPDGRVFDFDVGPW